jgi:hypothetical protein
MPLSPEYVALAHRVRTVTAITPEVRQTYGFAGGSLTAKKKENKPQKLHVEG